MMMMMMMMMMTTMNDPFSLSLSLLLLSFAKIIIVRIAYTHAKGAKKGVRSEDVWTSVGRKNGLLKKIPIFSVFNQNFNTIALK